MSAYRPTYGFLGCRQSAVSGWSDTGTDVANAPGDMATVLVWSPRSLQPWRVSTCTFPVSRFVRTYSVAPPTLTWSYCQRNIQPPPSSTTTPSATKALRAVITLANVGGATMNRKRREGESSVS